MAAISAVVCPVASVSAPSVGLKATSVQRSSLNGVAMPALSNKCRTVMSAERKASDVIAPSTVALLAAILVPEMAEAVSPGVSPSLKNLLQSVLAGGFVLGAIGVAVAGVSVVDPVKRR